MGFASLLENLTEKWFESKPQPRGRGKKPKGYIAPKAKKTIKVKSPISDTTIDFCAVCGQKVPKDNINSMTSHVVNTHIDDYGLAYCPSCERYISKPDLKDHVSHFFSEVKKEIIEQKQEDERMAQLLTRHQRISDTMHSWKKKLMQENYHVTCSKRNVVKRTDFANAA